MNLKPVYHRDDKTYRVVYRPHSRWIAQRFRPVTDLTIDRRRHDPWEDLHAGKPTRDEAIAIMHERKPLLPTK